MSVKNTTQPEAGDSKGKVRDSNEAASPKAGDKKEGTRWGAMEDWRSQEKGKGENPASRRDRLRDGK